MKYIVPVLFLLHISLHGVTSIALQPAMGPFFYGARSQLLVLGAAQISDASVADYSVAAIWPLDNSLTPLTPLQVTLNNIVTDTNPLRGQPCLAITLGGFSIDRPDYVPYVVMGDEPLELTCIRTFGKEGVEYVRTSPLTDAHNNPASAIGAISASGYSRAYACVAPQSGSMGDPGTGIACCTVSSYTAAGPDNTNITQFQFVQDAVVALDRTSPQVVVSSSPLSTLDNPVMYTAQYVWQFAPVTTAQQLFVGWHVVGPSDPASVVMAVVPSVGLTAGAMGIMPIVADTAAVTGNAIVCAQGADQEISITALATMQATSGGMYLVCVGGVGALGSQTNQVHALPLTYQGQLASQSAPLMSVGPPGTPLIVRGYALPATQAGDLYGPTDAPVWVGGGAAPGPVVQLWVSGDAVFVSVPVTTDGQAPGIFTSQALYNSLGKIAAWSPWQRAIASATPSRGYVYQAERTLSWQLTQSAPGVSDGLYKYGWLHLADALQNVCTQYLPAAIDGVQGIIDIPGYSPLFSTTVGARMSGMCLSGYGTLMFAMTSADQDGVLVPYTTYHTIAVDTDGGWPTIPGPVDMVVCQGGALATAGALITAAVATGPTQGGATQSWIVAGGNNGVYVLATNTGQGMPGAGLTTGWQGAPDGMTWQRIGSWTQVQKLWCQGSIVYVLTVQGLYSFMLTDYVIQQAGPDPAAVVTLIDTQLGNTPWYNQVLNDMALGTNIAVVAASNGLWQAVGDLLQVSSATWTAVTIPEGPGAANGIRCVASSGRGDDIAPTTAQGLTNMYVLGMSVSRDQARWYRYAITLNGNTPVITQLPDDYLVGSPTFYVTLGTYRTALYTDGALWAVMRSRTPVSVSFVQRLPSAYRVDNRIPLTLFGSEIVWGDDTVAAVGPLMRITGSGQWMFPTTVGVTTYA